MGSAVVRLWGLERERELLSRLIRSGRTGGCFIFTGPLGVGKTTLALAFAMALVCEQKPDEGMAFCGECRACRAIREVRGEDFIYLFPEGKFISHETVSDHQITLRAFQRPQKLSRRIILMDECEKLNPQSANQLLKTLEEAPSYTTFLLITDTEHLVLPTIMSRCRRILVGPARDEVLRQAASELFGQGILPAGLVSALGGLIALMVNLMETAGLAEGITGYGSLLAEILNGREQAVPQATRLMSELAQRLAETYQAREEERLKLVFGEGEKKSKLAEARKTELRRRAKAVVMELGLRLAMDRCGMEGERGRRMLASYLRLMQELRFNVVEATTDLDPHLVLAGGDPPRTG